ncbi:MAG: prepilin-type N-terminal cleavage/methylation domain-containing protein [Planctomycetia bacterium]
MKRTASRRRLGFTLLEILLALALFTFTAAALSRLVMLGSENAEYARLQVQGLLIAENCLAELDAGVRTVDDVGVAPAEENAAWQVEFTSDDAGPDYLYGVSVVAEHTAAGPFRGVTVRLDRLWFDEATAELDAAAARLAAGATTGSAGGATSPPSAAGATP